MDLRCFRQNRLIYKRLIISSHLIICIHLYNRKNFLVTNINSALMGLGQAIGKIPDPAYAALKNIGCPSFIASLLCDILLRSEDVCFVEKGL